MNVLQMRGFDAQVEIMGKAVDVAYRDGDLTIRGLSLANVHAILGKLASGEVVQEDGDALLTTPKKAATDETGKANDGAPPAKQRTRQRKPKEAPKPSQHPRVVSQPKPECKACDDSGVNSRGNPCAACRPDEAAESGSAAEQKAGREADAAESASMRTELAADAPPENPCPECGCEIGENDGNGCAACTKYEEEGRQLTARMQSRTKPSEEGSP